MYPEPLGKGDFFNFNIFYEKKLTLSYRFRKKRVCQAE